MSQAPCSAQKKMSSIRIKKPSIQQEATSIWRTINDIEFLEKQGYSIKLPNHPSIQSLISKSKNNKFGNDDFGAIYTLLETTFYTKKDYRNGFNNVREQQLSIHNYIEQLYDFTQHCKWDFKKFDAFTILFTFYGTGGSYDADQGIITLFTNQNGEFKNYDNPVNTIIHEIVHMGIEESIVQKYNLPHGIKERIVDTIVYLLFKKDLPEYRKQEMGDPNLDAFILSKKDIRNLDTQIEMYMAQYGEK